MCIQILHPIFTLSHLQVRCRRPFLQKQKLRQSDSSTCFRNRKPASDNAGLEPRVCLPGRAHSLDTGDDQAPGPTPDPSAAAHAMGGTCASGSTAGRAGGNCTGDGPLGQGKTTATHLTFSPYKKIMRNLVDISIYKHYGYLKVTKRAKTLII